jgi:phosphatidylinositol alpha-1,6-mannosyltransferase
MRPAPRINLIGGDAYSFTGGIQAVNRFVVRELAATGMLNRAFFLWDGDANVSMEGSEARSRGWARFFGRSRLKFMAALAREAVIHPSGVWLCMHLNYALLALLLACWRRRRVALFVYASEIDDQFTPTKAFALRSVGEVIVISRYTRDKVLRAGVNPSRVRVMYLGAEDPCPGWDPANITRRSDLVLFVGRMDERYKGQRELLDAMVLLRGSMPGLKLVFVGGGHTLPQWKAAAGARQLDGVVEFQGRVSDDALKELYRTATVFAMPSSNEGFGLVYVEAMAHGLPCISSDCDAAREVVVHGETGLCVPVGDAAALAQAIRSIVSAPGRQAEYARAGRERYLGHFSISCYRERLLCTIRNWSADLN